MTAADDGSVADRAAGRDDEPGSGLRSAPGRSPLLLAFVTCIVLALGYDAGVAGPVTLTVLSALGVVAGGCLLEPSARWPRLLGSTIIASGLVGLSVAVLPSTLGFGAGTGLGFDSPRGIGRLLAVAGGVGGLGFTLLVARDGWATLREVLRDGAVGALLVSVPLLVIIDGRFGRSLSAGGRTIVEAWTSTSGTALVSVQILALCTLVAAMVARPALDRLAPGRLPIPSVSDAVERARAMSEIGYWLLLGYVALWFLPGVLPAIGAAIEAMGVIGAVVGTLLRSGIVHGVLVTLTGLFLALGVGYALSPPVRRWLEPAPARTLSSAAGGIIVPVAVLLGGTAGTNHGTASLGALALLPLAFAFPIGWITGSIVDRTGVSRRQVLGIATGSLFAATMGLAADGLSPIGVLVGVATVILAWDLGTNALSMHRSVGPGVDASEPIATHATAVGGVLGVGVFLGWLALVAATVGDRLVTLAGAKATVVLLLGAVLLVATSGVRLSSLRFDFLARLFSRGKWALSNPLVLWLFALSLSVVLGWRVDSRFFYLTIPLAIAGPSVLIGGTSDDRTLTPRQRF